MTAENIKPLYCLINLNINPLKISSSVIGTNNDVNILNCKIFNHKLSLNNSLLIESFLIFKKMLNNSDNFPPTMTTKINNKRLIKNHLKEILGVKNE